jgi:GNAT superfamily N-acetyltransferase
MIRTANIEDCSRIKVLMQSVPGFWRDDWREDALELAVGNAAGLAFVWEEKNELLGFVCAHDLGVRAYLSELVVADPARGRGIGRQLVRRVEQEVAARGCTVLFADVWKDARVFYERLGWTPPDVVLLRKELGKSE